MKKLISADSIIVVSANCEDGTRWYNGENRQRQSDGGGGDGGGTASGVQEVGGAQAAHVVERWWVIGGGASFLGRQQRLDLIWMAAAFSRVSDK